MSPDIVKVGVGASNDLFVVWDDLRTDMNNIVDAGMMARLYLADKYPKPGYGPLSLKTSAADILGFTVVKEQTESNWSSNDLTAGQKEYAAVDAIVSLALHDELEGALARKEAESQVDIPSAWYTFNGSVRGTVTRETWMGRNRDRVEEGRLHMVGRGKIHRVPVNTKVVQSLNNCCWKDNVGVQMKDSESRTHQTEQIAPGVGTARAMGD
ncbi:ribonuclease H-like domain-containing protein [Mycena vitilis]|nr:ribonuclease H-like domain-containing protein [Mycena vitilis]